MPNTDMENVTLQSILNKRKEAFAAEASDYKKRVYAEGIQAVVDAGITSTAKQVGDKAPDFQLTNAAGKSVLLSDYIEKGSVILTWYRGGWCPYCNLTLKRLQLELPKFKELGAQLIALTPELPDKSLSTKEKNDLQFEVLSDIGNKVAHTYGVVFDLTPEVAVLYNEAFDIPSYNGDESNQLPLGATYVINPRGEITYAFLDADYRSRAEPADILNALRG